jgi:predicted DCC family thiol-disulfide oxidoreductase YuxK
VRAATGLTDAETAVAAWCVAPGARVGGARAIALAMAVARRTRLLLWPWRVPGLPFVLDRLYDLVATNRHRLPGVTPWCVAHPGECTED